MIRKATASQTRVLFLLFVFGLVLFPLGLWSKDLQPEGERWIGPGVRCYQILDPETPLATYVIEVDLSNPYITLELGMSRDRLTGNETVRSVAGRQDRPGHWVIGAVNGDFWADEGVGIDSVDTNFG